MPTLQAIPGRLVEVRRFTNVHLYYWPSPFGPTDRYELWLKPPDGAERKFTINTRIMPARRGHEVSLIVTAHQVPQVLGLANWSTIDGVNYVRTDAPPLVRAWDFVALVAAFLAAAILFGDIGMVLFVPAAVAYLLAVGLGRAMARTRRAAQVDRAIDAEERRTSRSTPTLQ
ncbi:MAG: hypothetical protein IPJ12_10560 [Betaproteobacteria bacterium]|nr:hypothetical protein [Betaproteobacteria bacterium]